MKMKLVSLLACHLLLLGFTTATFASHDDKNKFNISVNLNDDGGSISFPAYPDRERHHRHFRQPEWVDMREGDPLPANAVIGGNQFNPNFTLFVCRGNYRKGVHPGKLIAGKCNISWGGNEISLSRYQVLVSRTPVDWIPARFGNIPENAIPGGYENGNTLYICQTKYRNGVHPGKIVGQNCNIGWGGQEILKSSYRILVQP